MIKINYSTGLPGVDHRGSAYLPTVPRVGEKIWINFDGNNAASFEVIDVEYVHYIKRNVEGDIDYDKSAVSGFVNLSFESINVTVKELSSDIPDYPYTLPASEL